MDDAIAVLDGLISAFNGRDHARYESLLTDDVEAYAGVVTPLRFESKERWMAFVRGMEQFSSVTHERRHANYRSYNEDTVISNGYFVFTTVSADGSIDTQTGRESYTLVKVSGSWLVANLDFSAMF